MTEDNSLSSKVIPSELRRMELFDIAGNTFLTHTAVGLAFGGLASLVLFRKLFHSLAIVLIIPRTYYC